MQSFRAVSKVLRNTVLDTVLVLGVSILSIAIRGVSATYPLSINGFDSWYLFYNALLIAQAHGNWYAVPPDVHAWYPFGYFIELEDTIGLPLISALLSLPFYASYGPDSVYTVVLFLDMALAGLGVVAAYLSVESITKSRVGGLISALIIAVSPALTYKNLIGGLPKTSWGGVFVLFTIYLLNLAIERKKPWYGALASIPLFLAEISWGGYTYIDVSLLGAAFVLILVNRNDEVTAKSFTLMALFTAFLTSFSPQQHRVHVGFSARLQPHPCLPPTIPRPPPQEGVTEGATTVQVTAHNGLSSPLVRPGSCGPLRPGHHAHTGEILRHNRPLLSVHRTHRQDCGGVHPATPHLHAY